MKDMPDVQGVLKVSTCQSTRRMENFAHASHYRTRFEAPTLSYHKIDTNEATLLYNKMVNNCWIQTLIW